MKAENEGSGGGVPKSDFLFFFINITVKWRLSDAERRGSGREIIWGKLCQVVSKHVTGANDEARTSMVRVIRDRLHQNRVRSGSNIAGHRPESHDAQHPNGPDRRTLL